MSRRNKAAQQKGSVVDHQLFSYVHDYCVNPYTREIYLHSRPDLEEEQGVDFKMAVAFIKNLHVLDLAGDAPILVHLQSPGGDWGHGMAIFDAIRAAKSSIVILAHGEVSSMSGIIFQAGVQRIMMPSCEMMIHRGFLTLDGVSSTVQANALWNKKTDMKMLQVYASRGIMGKYFTERNMSHAQVLRFIDRKIQKVGDWNLDAEQAVYYGFCDNIFGYPGCESLENIRENCLK